MIRFTKISFVCLFACAAVLPGQAHAKAARKKGASSASSTASARSAAQPETMSPPALPSDGSAPAVRAASVVVLDARSGRILHTKNPDEMRPAASTQKLLTALIIAESGNLDQRLTVQEADTQAEPTKLGFRPGEIYTRRELLTVLLVHSTNDGALALARDNAGSISAFASKMNRKALELGMTNSHFVNPNGLPVPDQYSSARDMARVALAAYSNPLIRSIVCIKELPFRYPSGRVVVFKNTNQVLRGWPLCNGMKTGYTEAAGHCLISSAIANGKEIISVALGDNRQIWRDSYALLLWGLSSNSRSLGAN
jgi:D-alanyl-D-alanine carboxypeptidase (penicillin-binding protein 5/6)